jgi:large subunit ribosomal protein L4
MAEIKVFNASGQDAGSTLAAPAKLENANAKMGLIHQVAVAEMAGRRQGNASTKTRGEVQGSNAKIRRQKGTGRSRQGDKRTPHMRGGGVVHGPQPRDYSQSTPRKMRQAAFRTALNSRLQNDRVFVIDGALSDAKTKSFVATLSAMGLSDQKVLFVLGAGDENYALSSRNLSKVTSQTVGQTNTTDILGNDVVLCTRGAWEELTARVEGNLNVNEAEAA